MALEWMVVRYWLSLVFSSVVSMFCFIKVVKLFPPDGYIAVDFLVTGIFLAYCFVEQAWKMDRYIIFTNAEQLKQKYYVFTIRLSTDKHGRPLLDKDGTPSTIRMIAIPIGFNPKDPNNYRKIFYNHVTGEILPGDMKKPDYKALEENFRVMIR